MSYQQIGARLRAFARGVANLKRELGGMMFSGLISCVGLTALSVFAINVCSEALERERMQNAADASAYASATWFARGMNAITSLNHQLGEKTAYTVIAEAMAGPEPTYSPCKEEKEMNELLKTLKKDAPSYIRPSESKTIGTIIDDLIDTKKKQIGGGALYDAKMRTKYGEAVLLNNKSRANDLWKAGDHLRRIDLQLVAVEKHAEKNLQEDPALVVNKTTVMNDFLNKLSEQLQKAQNLLQKIADEIHNLNQRLEEVEKYLWGSNSIQAYLREAANEVRTADQTLEQYLSDEFKETQVYKDFKNNIDELNKQLNELYDNVLKDIEIDFNKVKVTVKTKELTEDMISELKDNVNFVNEAIETIRVEAEQIKNKIKREYDRILSEVRKFEEKVAREIDRIANQIDQKLSEVKKIADKATSVLNEVESVVRSVISALASAQENVDRLNEIISGKKPLSLAIKTVTGHNPINDEWKKLRELEKDLLNAKYGVVKVKNDLRQGVESISKELSTVAGAEKAVAERSICKLIYDGINKLLKKYGVTQCVVTPLDGPINEQGSSSIGSSNVAGSNVTQRIDASAGPIPTLPVVAEEEPVRKKTASTHLTNASRKKWKSYDASSSPYKKLPRIPWTGNDSSDYIEKVKKLDHEIFMIMYDSSIVQARIMEGSPHPRTHRRGKRAVKRLEKVKNKEKDIKASWKTDTDGYYGFKNNPSVWSYPTDAFDYETEKVTQWVRATYPALDTLRARVREKYKNDLKESNFTTYFIAWTYRYALSESFYCRSGMKQKRPYAGQGGNYVAKEPASMYVIPGTNQKNKGNEPMWTDPKLREQTIDKYFTVTATVQKTRPPIGNVKIFKRLGDEKGTAAIAEAFIYPANGRNEQANHKLKTKNGGEVTLQPFTAWDTLGWKNLNPGGPPEFAAQEWDSQPTLGGSELSYEDLMKKKKSIPGSERTAVEFTWQACMCPVTQTRLNRLANNKNANSTVRAAARSAAENASVVTQ